MIWYDIYIHGFFLLLESPRGFTEEENEENITGDVSAGMCKYAVLV